MDQIQEIVIQNEKQMKKFASTFFSTLKGGECILLQGDLGAGKTTFTKYLCKSAGVKVDVTSPTFTIMREYKGKKFEIIHFDLYRIEDATEVQEFGFEEYVYDTKNNQIVLIEWPYNIEHFTYPECTKIEIIKIDDTKRKLMITKRGK